MVRFEDLSGLVGAFVPNGFSHFGTGVTGSRICSDIQSDLIQARWTGSALLRSFLERHTGADTLRLLVSVHEGSGSSVLVRSEHPSEASPNSSSELVVEEALGYIQAGFGLTITSLAAILRVERPTVYAWLRGSSTPTASNLERISQIHSLAQKWIEYSGGRTLGADLALVAEDGKSLLDLLSSKYVRSYVIERILQRIAKRPTPARRPSIAERARLRGITSDDDSFDTLTGRRMTEEA